MGLSLKGCIASVAIHKTTANLKTFA